MVLNKLKKIRDEWEESSQAYDRAFKNTALIAAEVLQEKQNILDSKEQLLAVNLDKAYFINKYGSLKQAKVAYKKAYSDRKYGRSWQDFLKIARELPPPDKPCLTLEQRVTRIENILKGMGYQLEI